MSIPSATAATTTAVFLLLLTLTSGNPPPHSFKKIYAFGDSYTDTGNTASATGPSAFSYVSNLPYGRTFFHHPTNRYSDGRLVIDFLAESLSLPFLPPYLNRKADTSAGINYAVAGSTAIRHAFFVKNNLTFAITPQSLQTQLTWFNKTLEGLKCKSAISTPEDCAAVFRDALVWVGEIGANDYAYTVGSTVSGETIQRRAIRSVTGFLEALLNKGAKYMVWDAYRSVIKNAPKLGFHELYKVCCGSSGGLYNFDLTATCGSKSSSSCQNPSQYVNWDGVHLTEAMYKAVSEMFFNGHFTHPPFKYLLRSKQNSG
ncbi:hypothetical protein L1987_08239 [Smallanthus sonchifolius]|uniref:Uncharacterized protein n=1 Tax=Smallanthus sonchifolius TaxID=185202 RepID=A0ACB9JLT6_9ASTR|nr:hypothetical protein L1987_08239 [Smallanthus sonchifolius]